MTWFIDDIITLQKDNLKDFISIENPSSDLFLGYRDGTFDLLRLVQEITENKSIQNINDMRKALEELRRERFDLIDAIDKAEGKSLNNQYQPRPI